MRCELCGMNLCDVASLFSNFLWKKKTCTPVRGVHIGNQNLFEKMQS